MFFIKNDAMADDLVSILFRICTSNDLLYQFPMVIDFQFTTLVYQLVLPHELIKINIKIKSIVIIIYLTLFSSIKYSNTYSKIYIFYCLVTIDFICAPICLVELFVRELVLLSLPSYMNIW